MCGVITPSMNLADVLGRGRVDHEEPVLEENPALEGGAVAGFVATVATAIPILVMDISLLDTTIAGMYGFDGVLLVGIVAHLAHGTLFGLVFAFVMSDPSLVRVTEWRWKTLVAGVVYGLMLTVVGTGFILPVWLGATGLTAAPEILFVTPALVAWHLLYGAVLGGLYPEFEGLSR